MNFKLSLLEDETIALITLVISTVFMLVTMLINAVTLRIRLLNITHIFIIIHLACNGLIYYSNGHYIYCFTPIFSIYGPLFYLHVKQICEHSVSRNMLFLQFSPVVLITLAKLVCIWLNADILIFYYILALEGVSILAYGLYGFFTRLDLQFNVFNKAFTACGITFMVCGIFTLLNVHSALIKNPFVNGNVAYLNLPYFAIWMLMGISYAVSCILILTKYKYLLPASILRKTPQDREPEIHLDNPYFKVDDLVNTERYKMGKLSEAMLQKYSEDLHNLMQQKKSFLNSDLTLSLLASMLKISEYHLSQVLSIAIGDTFYSYINKLRIKYAVDLIQRDSKLNLEQVMNESGFNNRVSFNRYFKEVMSMQPSAYMKLVKQDTEEERK